MDRDFKQMEVAKERFAQAMGKNVDDLNTALREAESLEFERLKEFGIRVTKVGEFLKITFMGYIAGLPATKEAIKNHLEYIINGSRL